MKLTKEIIEMAKSKNGGWSQSQLDIIGVYWQPLAGWQNEVIGKEYSPQDLRKFVELKNKHI